MLTMLGWHSAPLPLGKKAQLKLQKQSTMAHVPRTVPVQTPVPPAQNAPTYYSFSSSTSYVLDTQRPQYGYNGQPATKNAPGYLQTAPSKNVPVSTSAPRTEYMTSSGQQIGSGSGDRNDSKNSGVNRSFKILPTHDPNAFIYARSEDAQSDTLTNCSTTSLDTTSQSTTTATSTTISRPDMNGRRNSVLMIANPGPGEALTSSTVPSPPESPHTSPPSLPTPGASLAANSQGRPLPRSGEEQTRSRSGSGDSGSSRRRGSGSDSEKPSVLPPGPSPSRSSPPRSSVGGRFPDKPPRDSFVLDVPDSRPPYRAPNTPSASTIPPRDAPPQRRDSDTRMQVDAPRSRRLSGAVIPHGYGPGERVSPPNIREISPPMMRSAPSGDGKRERYSPDRENGSEFTLERRVSGSVPVPQLPPGSYYDRERPQNTRSQYSNGSGSGSASSRERHSPQEEEPRSVGFMSGPPLTTPIRSRSLSSGRRDEAPKQIIIAGVEAAIQGPGRTVRFSERLICPSPVPLEKRRKGCDQLWTNDGVFLPADPGSEYPVDMNEYPDVGTGWMNEEGTRIDMQHRLVPKAPLRPALKRTSTSSSSSSTQQQQQMAAPRPEARAFYSSASIREEI